MGDRMEAMGRRVGTALRGIALSAAAMGTAMGAAAVKSLNAVKEMKQIADSAQVNVERFQELAHAANTVGVAQDQLGDILRDTKEKMGEFLATGGGEMKDFFENIAPKVNLAKDAFKGLSGDQGLQLYYDSLIKAGLGEKEVIFYMEALANDASKLIPLLRNNGAEMNRLAQEARDLGLVLDKDVVANSVEASKAVDTLWKVLSANLTNFVARNASSISALADAILKLTRAAIDGAGHVAHFLGLSESARAVNSYNEQVARGDAYLNNREFKNSGAREMARAQMRSIIGQRTGVARVQTGSYLGGLIKTHGVQYRPEQFGRGKENAAPTAIDAGLPASTFGAAAGEAKKTGSAAKAAKPEVDKLAEALDRLFPEEEQLRRLQEVRRLLDQGLASGRLTQSRYDDASRRLAFGGEPEEPGFLNDFFGEGTLADTMPKMTLMVGEMGQVTAKWGDNVKDAADLAKTSMADAAESIAQSLSNLGNAFRGGGILDILSGVLGIATQLGSVGLFGKSIQMNLNKVPGVNGARANGGPVRAGGTYLVGERGPELVKFNQGGHVFSNADSAGMMNGRGAVVVKVEANDYFDARVDSRAAGVAAPIAVASGMQARGAARSDVAQAGRRRIPGR